MRVLVLGASGMLGHKLLSVLSGSVECWGTARPQADERLRRAGYDGTRLVAIPGLPVGASLDEALDRARPDVVVNCIGVVKQSDEATNAVRSIEVNSLFPHQVAEACSTQGSRLIHISTDCVFSGKSGGYSERETPDAVDLYGRSKLLGEVTGNGHLTLRTSIIGRELAGAQGLLEWFLSQRGRSVRGFERAFFSGLTTLSLARVIEEIVLNHDSLSGLYHVASPRIDKFDLLQKLNDAFATGTEIMPDQTLSIDRSLDGSEFTEATGISVPDWDDMVEAMARDSNAFGYDRLRANLAGS